MPRELYRLTASLTRVLDLIDAVVADLGLVADDLVSDDWFFTHQIKISPDEGASATSLSNELDQSALR